MFQLIALNWNKLVDWNNIEEHIQFQLKALAIIFINLTY